MSVSSLTEGWNGRLHLLDSDVLAYRLFRNLSNQDICTVQASSDRHRVIGKGLCYPLFQRVRMRKFWKSGKTKGLVQHAVLESLEDTFLKL